MVSNFTRLTAREITYNNFEISLVVFMPNITTNHAITYTNMFITNLMSFIVGSQALNWTLRTDRAINCPLFEFFTFCALYSPPLKPEGNLA